jgi:hypothetical protein
MRVFLVVFAVVHFSCSLRPFYRDMVPVSPKSASTVQLQVVEKGTQRPIANARIELGEGKDKFLALADGEGRFSLPVDKKHFDENALLVVSTPAGYHGYSVIPLRAESVPPTEVPPMPALDNGQLPGIDAGVAP